MTLTDEALPRYYGIYRATVSDNADPEQRHRLLLIVPAVGGSKEPMDWALPCFDPLKTPVLSNPGGTGAHTHTITSDGGALVPKLPAHGDAVWVMFEAGNPRQPVWLGTWRY